MPHYKGLEEYIDPQRKIKVHSRYSTESTVASDFAKDMLTDLAARHLKNSVLAAKALQSKGLTTKDVSGNMSIRERAKFFEENTPAKLAEQQSALNARNFCKEMVNQAGRILQRRL